MRILLLMCLALPALGSDVQQHVVGGSDASISAYPHQLSLRISGSHYCGASLVANNRAVTTADCTGLAVETYTVLGGASSSIDETCGTCVLRDLTFISRHPGFDDTAPGNPNDIAVFGFVPVTFNDNLQPIGLVNPTDGSLDGMVCTFTGWGSMISGDAYSDILQQAQASVISNEACAGVWGASQVNDGHICISDFDATPCNGDWGGPLECNNRLAGAASWIHGYCDPAYPGIYTRISAFHAWIIDQ
jgi:secreted trypsin-like serine protease